MFSESISTTLINRASEGDSESCNKLMELSHWVLSKLTNRLLDDQEEIEDLIQETLTVVVKVMATEKLRLDNGRHSYIKLLKSCLRNVVANHFRKLQIAPAGGSENLKQLENLIDHRIETIEETRDFAEGVIRLSGLSENEQQVLNLFLLSGKSTADIAYQMNMTPANIRKIRSRALQKIRIYLGED